MRKFFSLTFLIFVLAATSFSQQYVDYPFGKAQSSTMTMTASATTLAVTNQVVYATGTVGANTTINLTKTSGIRTGAIIYMKLTGTVYKNYTVKFGTYFRTTTDSIVLPGTAVRYFQFVYDGTYYNCFATEPFPSIDVISRTPRSKAVTLTDTIFENVTYLDIATLDTNVTINLTVDDNINIGAQLFIETTADGTNRTVTYGTGLKCSALTNSSTKTFVTSFIWVGGYFKAYGQKQND